MMRKPFVSWLREWMCLSVVLGAAVTARAQADGSSRWAFTTLSTATAGSILSSPAVGPDGTIYIGVEVGASTSASASGRLFALNPNGSQKWVFTAPDWIDSTPAISPGPDATIYFGCWNGMLYALNPDGTKRWEFKAGSFVASSPAIGTDGTIYVGAGSNLVAVNPDGSLKWSFPAADWIDSSPAIGPDGTIYVGSWDNTLYAVTPAGAERWRFVADDNITSSPAIAADGSVYFGSRDLRVYALAANGTLRWSFDTGDTVETSPVLGADGTVYVASTGGRLFALNRDGTERWRYPAAGQPALAPIYSSAAVRADGSIVFGTSNNALHALRADGSLLWRGTLGDSADSSPLVTEDAIYIGCADKKLYAFNSAAGASATDWSQFRRDGRRTAWQPLGAVAGTQGRLVNLSVRTFSGIEADTLIVGFYVGGSGARSLLVRGVGPTLTSFGVGGVLANPRISAFTDNATMVAANDDWSTASNAGAISSTATAVGAFPLPGGSLDAALLNTFSAGGYTVQVSGAGGATGVALMEAYDAAGAAGARLSNVSARSAVNANSSGVLIAGFVVGQNTRAVLVRGVGPRLATLGVDGAMPNPQLRIFQDKRLVAENDDWGAASNAVSVEAAAKAVGAFSLVADSRDAVVLLTLPPNAYTAQVSGVGGTGGVALIEVYEVP